MKKVILLGTALLVAMAFTACKSNESAYKKAYEKAKQNELATSTTTTTTTTTPAPVVEAAPVVDAAPVTPVSTKVTEEKVQLVSGDGLKAFSVVCGSFGVKANADNLKSFLDNEGYQAKVVYNSDKNMYRVIVESFDVKEDAARARDSFKAKYPSRSDFQKSWLLYRIF